MNRPLTAVFSALESLLVVGIGIGIPLLPLTLLWGFHYELQVDWVVFWRVAADAWLVGHGASLEIAPDASVGELVGLPGATTPFVFSLAPLGFALLTLLLGRRAGRRIAETPYHLTGLGVAAAAFAAFTTAIALTATHEVARPVLWQAILFPTLVFLVGVAFGAAVTRGRLSESRPRDIFDRFWAWATDWPAWATTVVGSALTAGAAAVASVMLVASLIVAVLVAVQYGTVIGLFEASQGGALGALALTIAQLAYVPNLVVWCAAWLVGPGFAIGAGSMVSPLGTHLGPIPPIPVLGAIPTGDLPWAFAGIAVPVLIGFLLGAVLQFRPGVRMLRPLHLVTLGALVGIVAGVLFALLSGWSAGAGGPGRLAEVGPDPLLVGAFGALEVGVACVLGLLVGVRREDAAADAGAGDGVPTQAGSGFVSSSADTEPIVLPATGGADAAVPPSHAPGALPDTPPEDSSEAGSGRFGAQ